MDIKSLIEESHRIATEKGWNPNNEPRPIPELLVLIHSEVSEALEEYRKGHAIKTIYYTGVDDKPEGFPVEIADVVIRIADLCGQYSIDLEDAIRIKTKYNKTRSFRHGNKVI